MRTVWVLRNADGKYLGNKISQYRPPTWTKFRHARLYLREADTAYTRPAECELVAINIEEPE